MLRLRLHRKPGKVEHFKGKYNQTLNSCSYSLQYSSAEHKRIARAKRLCQSQYTFMAKYTKHIHLVQRTKLVLVAK